MKEKTKFVAFSTQKGGAGISYAKIYITSPSIHCFSVATPHTCGSSNMVSSRPIPSPKVTSSVS